MYKMLKKIALMLTLVPACVFLLLFAACKPEEEPAKLTYTVTVTADDGVSLADVKAQWKQGDSAAAEVPLNEGKASAELVAGNYTVTLTGVPADCAFENAEVTAENRDAAIEVKKPAPAASRLSVIVSLPQGIDQIPQDLKVQVYKGETGGEKFGNPVAVDPSTKIALVSGIERSSQTYRAELVGLPDYLACAPQTFTPSKSVVEITMRPAYAEVDYTVNITKSGVDDGELAGGKITFSKDGTPVEGASELEITGSSVTVRLTAGNYTVEFIHDDKALESTAATVTPSQRTAEITVTAHKYTITVDRPANITDGFEGMEVVLTDGEGNQTKQNCNQSGVAEIKLVRGDYFVTVTGYKHLPVKVSAQQDTATVKLAAELNAGGDGKVTLTGAGRYYVAVEAEQYWEYDLDAEKEVLYDAHGTADVYYYLSTQAEEDKMFAVTYFAEEGDGLEVNGYFDSRSRSELIFILNKDSKGVDGENIKFKMSYTTGDEMAERTETRYIVFEVAEKPVPPLGTDKLNPVVLETYESEQTITSELGDVWYALPDEFPSHKITFEGDLHAEHYNYMGTTNALNSGDFFSREAYGYIPQISVPEDHENYREEQTGALEFLHVYGNGQISFKLVQESEPGASAETAAALTEGIEYFHYFTDWLDWYYKFTPSATGYYQIAGSGEYADNYSRATVWEGETTESTYEDAVIYDMTGDMFVRLEQSKTYLIKIAYTDKGSVTFTLSAYQPKPGEILENPAQVTGAGSIPAQLAINESNHYYYHEVTAESLNMADELKLEFEIIGGNNFQITFYSDPDFSTKIPASEPDGNSDGYYDGTYTGVYEFIFKEYEAGETLYFTITCYKNDGVDKSTANLYINRPPLLKANRTTEAYAEVAEENGKWTADIAIDESVAPGKYKLGFTSEKNITGEFKLTVGENSYTAGADSELGTSGYFIIEIADGADNIHAEIAGIEQGLAKIEFSLQYVIEPSEPISFTFETGSSVNVRIALSDFTPGIYTLKLEFVESSSDQYTFTVGGIQTYMSGYNVNEYTAKINIPDGCNEITMECSYVQTANVTLTIAPLVFEHTIEKDVPLENVQTSSAGTDIKLGESVIPGWYTLSITNPQAGHSYTLTLGENSREFGEDGKLIIKIESGALFITITNEDGDTVTLELEDFVYVPESYSIGLDQPVTVKIVPYTDDGNVIKIALDGAVTPGEYTLAFDNCTSGMALSNTWYIAYGDGEDEELWDWSGYEDPVQLTVPDGCTEITITAAASPNEYTVELTLSKSA